MTDIRLVLVALCDAFNARDLDRIMGYFADDCVLEMPRGAQPWGTRFEGKDGVRRGLTSRFQGLPDLHLEIPVSAPESTKCSALP